MRRPPLPGIAVLLALFSLTASAQNRAPDLQPIPEPPPPPPGLQEPPMEPQVTITRRGEDRVEEFRLNGKLYMLKVTPPHGTPYYLVDHQGKGNWMRQDSLDSGLRVPQWVIHSF